MSEPKIRDVVESPDERPAVPGLSWAEIARFCNWVSQKEALPRAQWCYEDDDDGGIRPKDGWEFLTGYRLPTEAELEYAIRAGAATSRFFGEGEELLERYAWFAQNSGPDKKPHRVAELRPNDFGLFDALGDCFVLANDQLLDDSGRAMTIYLGGAYFTQPGSLRSANRKMTPADIREIGLNGWRLVRTIPERSALSLARTGLETLTATERRH